MSRSRVGRARWIALVAGTFALAVAWAVPSDVVELVVRQRPVLLGRYSEGKLVGLCLATALFLPVAAMLLAGTRAVEIVVRMALLLGSVALGFAVVSILSAVPISPRYLETPVRELVPAQNPDALEGITRRRQPDQRFEIRRGDSPPQARSYPDAPPGFPEAEVVLTTDENGFRNLASPPRVDVVVTGDSFAEGSMVDDTETWPALLAEATGRSVYSVAMSGASPWEYLNNLAAFGLPRHPRVVLVMIYEGNDFKRSSEPRVPTDPDAELTPGERLRRMRELAFEDSPVRARLKRWLLQKASPVAADAPLPEDPALSWMPVRVTAGGSTSYYAFEPKRLMRLAWTPERFEGAPEWTTNERIFLRIRDVSRRHGAEPVFVYAPSKPHVVMPVVRDRVPPEALHAFASHASGGLSEPERFARDLYARLGTQERVFLDFCAREGIACLSPTEALRDRLAAGEPVYFTYDQHWTRLGHQVVARCAERLPALAADGGAPPPPAVLRCRVAADGDLELVAHRPGS